MLRVTVEDEDHTLGCLLRDAVFHIDPKCFAAFIVPHPLERNLVISVRSSTCDERRVLQDAIEHARDRIADIRRSLDAHDIHQTATALDGQGARATRARAKK